MPKIFLKSIFLKKKQDPIFPKSLKEFIFQYIDSVELLEVLLLLYKNKATRGMSVDQINQTLRSNPKSIRVRLKRLEKDGFIKACDEQHEAFKYAPKSSELDSIIEKLAEAHGSFRLRLIEYIYQPSRAQIKEFADAFKLKREENEDDS